MNFVRTVVNQFPMNAQLRFSGDELEFNLSGVGDAPNWNSVSLSEAVAQYSQDHGCIAIGEINNQPFVCETTAISVSRRMTSSINLFNTERSDSPLAVYRSLGGGAYPATLIFTPYKGCSLSECVVYLFDSAGPSIYEETNSSPSMTVGVVKFEIDGRPVRAPEVGKTSDFFNEWLPISVNGPGTILLGGKADFTIDAHQNTEIYLESTAGTLNRSRAKNGDVVTLDAAGLSSGEIVRIKAGYKFWPGKVDLHIEVV